MIKDEAELIDYHSQKENVFSKGFYLEGALHSICEGLLLHPSLVNPDSFRELFASPSLRPSLIHASRAMRPGIMRQRQALNFDSAETL